NQTIEIVDADNAPVSDVRLDQMTKEEGAAASMIVLEKCRRAKVQFKLAVTSGNVLAQNLAIHRIDRVGIKSYSSSRGSGERDAVEVKRQLQARVIIQTLDYRRRKNWIAANLISEGDQVVDRFLATKSTRRRFKGIIERQLLQKIECGRAFLNRDLRQTADAHARVCK